MVAGSMSRYDTKQGQEERRGTSNKKQQKRPARAEPRLSCVTAESVSIICVCVAS